MSLEVSIKKNLGNFNLEVDLNLPDGVITLLGASGCGKSMTLKCIAGIETPDEGRIVLNNKILFDSKKKINLPPQKRQVGYMFQDYALFMNMTVEENIMSGMKKCSKKERLQRVSRYIRDYHLEGLGKHYPSMLSGGQKQRVAMARMMASEPEMILLDEPFAALDSYLKSQMLEEMKLELSKMELPVLFVTHSRDEAFILSNLICSIDHGRSEEVVETKQFFSNPKTVNAAILSGCKNISSVSYVDETHIMADDWNMVLPVDHAEGKVDAIGIRAHNLAPRSETLVLQENEFTTGKVSTYRVEETLFEWNIYLDFEGSKKSFLWKIPKVAKYNDISTTVPTQFIIKREHIMLLKRSVKC